VTEELLCARCEKPVRLLPKPRRKPIRPLPVAEHVEPGDCALTSLHANEVLRRVGPPLLHPPDRYVVARLTPAMARLSCGHASCSARAIGAIVACFTCQREGRT
jgi:hypothetical protein